MKNSEFIEGLQILAAKCNPNGYGLSAGHDQFWFHATDKPLNQTEVARLLELGWLQEDGADDENPEAYDPDESWTAYV